MTQNTGAGHLLAIGFSGFGSTTRTISSISAGGTFVHCSNCSKKDTNNNQVDAGYVLSSLSGVGSITVTMSGALGGTSYQVEVAEYSTTLQPAVFDVSASKADTTCTSCSGQALTLTGSNDTIFTTNSPNAGCSAISGAYTNPNDAANGFAGAINQSSASAPTWTCTSGTMSVTAEAFKETAVHNCAPSVSVLGAGRC